MAIRKSGFKGMPYPYTSMFAPEPVPKQFLSRFGRNVAQYAFLAIYTGTHLNGFAPQFGSCFRDIDIPFMKDSPVISNKTLPTTKLTIPNSKKALGKSEKSISLVACIVNLFSRHGGLIFDSFAPSMTLEMAAEGYRIRCISIERNTMC